MSHSARLVALVLTLTGTVGALGACRGLIGIDEGRNIAEQAGDGGRGPVEAGDGGRGAVEADPSASPECQEYCDHARGVCGDLLYRSDETCLATCALMPLVGFAEDSVACRLRELTYAAATAEDLEGYCANAGPGGNGICGSNCESYCRIFKAVCARDFQKYIDVADDGDGSALCVSKCQGLPDTHLYDARDSGNYRGDTLQCRLVRATFATVDPARHCVRADLKSIECVDDSAPDCDAFCHLELTECAGYPVYENEEQCKAVCQALPSGQANDVEENTVACRMYHSYNALLEPKTHCPHTGPGGDGHCGSSARPETGSTGNCESYCMLLAEACKSEFDAKFANPAECQAECVKLDGAGPSSGYTTESVGNNLQCRLLHVSRAVTGQKKECEAAFGAAPCE